ncbi:MAG: hypothetical protein HKL95_05385, partial [Phycisphaerae bacterium]|nr:hypothetical protein [Phycisphaerae bacterium]
ALLALLAPLALLALLALLAPLAAGSPLHHSLPTNVGIFGAGLDDGAIPMRREMKGGGCFHQPSLVVPEGRWKFNAVTG